MAMICPQCLESFSQRLQCPHCGVRLQYQSVRHDSAGHGDENPDWQQTPWGRLFVGLLIAQGLYYGLRQLWTAGILATEEPSDSVWVALTGIIVIQGLQAIGVVAAGILSGACQRRGMLFGAAVGVWNGVFLILGRQWLGQSLTPIALVGEPILQATFGALGGLIGSKIWKPLPSFLDGDEPQEPIPARPRPASKSSFSGPISWGRVLTGVTLAVGGVVWTDVIREFVLEASEGRLRIDTHLQAGLVTWEISALALLLGSALAGASTSNGLKQGLATGVGVVLALLVVRLGGTGFSLQEFIFTSASALSLSMAGGWFGSQLLPPLQSARHSHVRISAMV
jgi:hypothetical protein